MSNKTALSVLYIFIAIDVLLAIWLFSSHSIPATLNENVPQQGTKYPSTQNATVNMISDIPNVTVASYDKKQLLNILNQLHFFDPQGARYHTDASTTAPLTITHLTIHFTQKSQPYASFTDTKGIQLYGEGETYNQTAQSEDIFLFISPSVISNTNVANLNLTSWNYLSFVFWELTQPNGKIDAQLAQEIQSAARRQGTLFLTQPQTPIPFALYKTS